MELKNQIDTLYLPFQNINFYEWWKPLMENGRQRWKFSPPPVFSNIDWEGEDGKLLLKAMQRYFKYDSINNPNTSDKVLQFYNLKKNLAFEQSPFEDPVKNSLHKGWQFMRAMQEKDGNWSGDYGGPLFLLPGLIIVSYITKSPFHAAYQVLMIQYMLNHQNEDGGWGMHIEGHSTMFGTVMQYIALRLLGENQNSPAMKQAKRWIKQHGGAINIPSWGKFYLSILGVYEWEGCNTLMPEMWLLPKNWPVHPSKYWCHARMVYLPMSYCFGVKLKAARDEITASLLSEIYVENYEEINWIKARNSVSPTDVFVSPSPLLHFFYTALNYYENFVSKNMRAKALAFVRSYIEAEDQQTNYINIGPVNQIINSLAVWHFSGKESVAFQQHVKRWEDYLWVAEDGIKMNGYNGSQLWDTAFATQALLSSNVAQHFESVLMKADEYISGHQLSEEPYKHLHFYRHTSIGGWPFSTLQHGWPITDCTAEGLKSCLHLRDYWLKNYADTEKIKSKNYLQTYHLFQAVDLLLSFQNKDGGWATYELQRAPAWSEWLNPSEVFGKIMTDYSWTECTSACMQALHQFQIQFPNYKFQEIQTALQKGKQFILSRQKNDGSWEGAWAVCFTYGTWFGVEALIASGSKGYSEDEPLQKACNFLVEKQDKNGSWGESYRSCVEKKYVPHSHPQIVNTAWAMMSLIDSNYPNREVIDKAAYFLMKTQKKNGSWPQGGISGVFNLNCMITYSNYKNIFPLWALGKYLRYIK